jgi:AraC-like DNA-binding protein/copper chaperone CopZ
MKQEAKIFIKGMVCRRCVMAIEEAFEDLGHALVKVELGEVTVLNHDEKFDKAQLEKRLTALGFSLLEDRKVKMVNEIKALVAEVYSGDYDFPDAFRFSNLVRARWNKDYDAISDLFIALEKRTLEQYIIDFRINKVKEYLVYSQYTLADIAFKLNFNSVAHLSAQFKQYTGLTPSYFREIKKKKTEVIFSAN